MGTTEERFYSKFVELASGCWQWMKSIQSRGYGTLHLQGKTELAHRVAYKMWRGPIPEGLQIDHLCQNRDCVNPDHLELVTSQINTLRGETIAAREAKRTHCPRGHIYDLFNTERSKKGKPSCCECRRQRQRARYHDRPWPEEADHD